MVKKKSVCYVHHCNILTCVLHYFRISVHPLTDGDSAPQLKSIYYVSSSFSVHFHIFILTLSSSFFLASA